MSNKRPVSVNLSERNIEWIDGLNFEEYDSRSEFVDELISECRKAGGQVSLLDRLEQRELESRKKRLENRLEAVESDLADVRQSVTTEDQWRQETVEEAVDQLAIDPSVGYDHAAAEHWADKANMDVQAFWERYTEAYNE